MSTAGEYPFSLNVPQVAEILSLPTRTVYDLLPRGQIPGARKVGQQWRVNRDVLLAWLKGDSASRCKEKSWQ